MTLASPAWAAPPSTPRSRTTRYPQKCCRGLEAGSRQDPAGDGLAEDGDQGGVQPPADPGSAIADGEEEICRRRPRRRTRRSAGPRPQRSSTASKGLKDAEDGQLPLVPVNPLQDRIRPPIPSSGPGRGSTETLCRCRDGLPRGPQGHTRRSQGDRSLEDGPISTCTWRRAKKQTGKFPQSSPRGRWSSKPPCSTSPITWKPKTLLQKAKDRKQ